MTKYDITARTKKRSYRYAGKTDNIFNNLFRTDIKLEDYEIVFSDIFEFRLSDSSKVYCCFALRKVTRQIVSFVFSYHRPVELVTETLNHINLLDLSNTNAIWHSDQGGQYGVIITVKRLLELGFTISMSRAGV